MTSPITLLGIIAGLVSIASALLECGDEGCDADFTASLLQKTAQLQRTALHIEPEEFFVSPDVDDVHAAVQECVDKLRSSTVAGSSCKLRGGTYRLQKPVEISGFTEEIQKHITAADPEERPRFDGTKDITALDWKPVALKSCPTGCYAAEYDGEKPWQLFVGEDMVLNARWPNAKWSDKSLFEATKSWAQASDKSTFSGPSSGCAKPPNTDGTCPSGLTKVVIDGVDTCQDHLTQECKAGLQKGHVHTLGPAESFMDDATQPPSEYGSKPLRDEDFDATGASVILNVGHWMSYASTVKKHTPKSNSFTYMSRAGWNVMKYVHTHTIYYLENSLELLDAPGEWYFDGSKIYIMPPSGETPTSWAAKAGPITARIQTYAFEITEATKLTFSSLDFFATTIFAAADRGPWDKVNKKITSKVIKEMVWDDLVFKYPSASKRILGENEIDYIAPTTITMIPQYGGPVWNTIRNSQFFYVDGPTIEFGPEQGITIENNLFEWIDWTAVSYVTTQKIKYYGDMCFPIIKKPWCFGASASALWLPSGSADAPNKIIRNTIMHTGGSTSIGFFGKGTNMLVELNRIGDKKDLQLDGGQISMPARATHGVVLRKNWAFDSNPPRGHSVKWGLRFDRGQSTCSQKWGTNGGMFNNVVWNTNGINLKGNSHRVVQNTVFDSSSIGGSLDDAKAIRKLVDVNLYASRGGIGTCECTDSDCKRQNSTCCNAEPWSKENALTEVVGNLMESCGGTEGGIPWKVSTQEVDEQYRLIQGITKASSNVAGQKMKQQLRDPENLDFRPKRDTVAGRQCVGAYADVPQDGSSEYWIPGHQYLYMATSPMPPDGTKTMKKSGALAFNQALKADSHKVFVSDVATAGGGFQCELTTPNNIITLPTGYNTPGKQYYWRVDPVVAGVQKAGAVWQYQVADEQGDQEPAGDQCISFAGKVGSTNELKNGRWNYFGVEVPANGGLSKRFTLQSTKICVHTTAEFASSYQLRLKHNRKQKLLGAFWGLKKPERQQLQKMTEIHGCFSDGGEKFQPSSIVDKAGASWKPMRGGWEKIDSIDQFISGDDMLAVASEFKLAIKDQKATGQLKAWSMEFCFFKAPAQPLPDAGGGACPAYGYS